MIAFFVWVLNINKYTCIYNYYFVINYTLYFNPNKLFDASSFFMNSVILYG